MPCWGWLVKSKKLTQKRLREVLDYNPCTGFFIWRVRDVSMYCGCKNPTSQMKAWNVRCSGAVAGSLRRDGYVSITIDGIKYFAHRLSFLYMYGYIPENEVDHINRVKNDNRWCNLREVSKQCNMRNCGVIKSNKSGVTGISWNNKRKKWCAQIKVNNKNIGLGLYYKFRDAVKARWKAEVKYGFPNCNTTSTAYEYLKENNKEGE